nr:hypothetical protein [Fodinicola acaciae]
MTTPSVATAPVGDPWPEEDANVLAAMLRDAEREYRKAAARVLKIVKAIEHKEAYEQLQAKNMQQLPEDQLLLSPTEASRRVQRAGAFCPGMALTGELLTPSIWMLVVSIGSAPGCMPIWTRMARRRRTRTMRSRAGSCTCTPVATAASRCAAFSTPRPVPCCRKCCHRRQSRKVKTASPILDQLPSVTVTRLPTS